MNLKNRFWIIDVKLISEMLYSRYRWKLICAMFRVDFILILNLIDLDFQLMKLISIRR